MERLTVFTANIGRKDSPGQREQNIRKVKQGTKELPNVIVGWQEIDEADTGNEHGMLKEVWPHQRFGAMSTAVPVLSNRPVEMYKVQITKTCDGRAQVSPTRFCVQAILHIGDLRLVHLNGHYPYNAPDLRRECNAKWREIANLWFDKGWSIVTTRDTNWHGRMPKLHPRERLLTPAGAIDRITVIEKDITFRVARRHRINLNIDGHDAVGVTLTLKGRK